MTEVLERIKGKVKDFDLLVRTLESKPLSRCLRRETWTDHERAEYSPFEVALATATIPRPAYLELLQQVYPVYIALEERAEELKDDAVAGRVFFPELNRREALEADIEFYGGADWRETTELLPVTEGYVERIRNATPIQFVAHHYNRYMADLSGGLIICAALKREWGLDGDGVKYYDFAIEDATEWKNNYRSVLDGLPLSTDEKIALIDEVMAAYDFNIEMVRVLAEKHDIKADASLTQAPHHHHPA
jgi:heme oxygenase